MENHVCHREMVNKYVLNNLLKWYFNSMKYDLNNYSASEIHFEELEFQFQFL